MSTPTPTAVFRVVLAAMDLAERDPKGEFYLSDAVTLSVGWLDPQTIYGYTGNAGLSGALQNLGIIEHAPVKGHFRFTAGYEFPGNLV